MSFIRKQNIEMLWDVISDENNFRFLSHDIQNNIYHLFLNNIQGFYESEKSKTSSLVELNKKYILLILNHIKTTYPYEPNKIKIHNEQPVKEFITFEEIKNDRQSQFEKKLNKLQSEFDDTINIKAPPTPVFKDKDTDRPIKEIDKLVKEMQAQRNYEIEQINRITNSDDNWLKPQETSLKKDKFEQPQSHEKQSHEQNNQSKFKYLNNLSSPNTKKNVSFNDNDEVNLFNEIEDEEDTNIFLKLKKVNNSEENIQFKKSQITPEERMNELERNINTLNTKLNLIMDLLNQKNNI
jgi:hypothetical protein